MKNRQKIDALLVTARKFRMEKRFAPQMYYNHDHHPYFVIAYMIDKDELDSVHTIIIILQSNMQSALGRFQSVSHQRPTIMYNGTILFPIQLQIDFNFG